MIRKLISLTEDLDQLIELTALQEQKPQAAVIREKLRAGFTVQKQHDKKIHPLMSLAKHAVGGIDPLTSLKIDTYLYEE